MLNSTVEKNPAGSAVALSFLPWNDPGWAGRHAGRLRQAIHDNDLAAAHLHFNALRALLSAHLRREARSVNKQARFLPAETRDGACWIVKTAQDALTRALDHTERLLATPCLSVPSAHEAITHAVDRLEDVLSTYEHEVERAFYGPLASGGHRP